jgi:hypothetical protein
MSAFQWILLYIAGAAITAWILRSKEDLEDELSFEWMITAFTHGLEIIFWPITWVYLAYLWVLYWLRLAWYSLPPFPPMR